jgi:ubiquinone/menaquinone biosynthesis C-methylase UbiE
VSDDVIVEAFTELAPLYEETVDREVREFCGLGYREFIGLLADMVPVHESDTILDVACGTAVSSLEMARRASQASSIVGLDITPAMLRLGIRNLEAVHLSPRISLVCASAMKMPLANCGFDAVVCGLGMHHMDVPEMLADMRRVLKDGGHLILADMGAPAHWRSPWGRVAMRTIVQVYRTIRTHARAQAEADAFHNIHTKTEWRHILSNFGFGQIEIEEWPPRRWWYPSAVIMRAVKETPG